MVAVIATTAAHKDLVDSSPASPRAPTTTTMTLEQTFGFLQFLLFFLFFSLSSLPPRVPVFACRPTATGLSPQFPPPIVHLKSQTYAHNYNYDRSFQQRGLMQQHQHLQTGRQFCFFFCCFLLQWKWRRRVIRRC